MKTYEEDAIIKEVCLEMTHIPFGQLSVAIRTAIRAAVKHEAEHFAKSAIRSCRRQMPTYNGDVDDGIKIGIDAIKSTADRRGK